MASFLRQPWLLFALLAAVLVAVVHAAPLVEEETFTNIKNYPAEQMVVFYRSSEADSERILKIVKKAAKRVKEDMPNFRFRKCDCDRAVNKGECDEAQFKSGTYLFTSTPGEGIVKYSLTVDVKTITRHINSLYMDADEGDVLEFEDEDSFYEMLDDESDTRPIFLKFYEKWCEHCKRLAKPFAVSATYFKDRVRFMEIECSRNEDTTAFCTRAEVRSYPALKLYTGEDKIAYNEEQRGLVAFENFFNKHVPASDAATTADEEEEEVKPKSSIKKKAGKKNKAVPKKKAAKKAVEEEEEEDEEYVPVQKPSKQKKGTTPSPTPAPTVMPKKVAVEEDEEGEEDVLDPKLASLGSLSNSGKLSVEARLNALEELLKKIDAKLDQVIKA